MRLAHHKFLLESSYYNIIGFILAAVSYFLIINTKLIANNDKFHFINKVILFIIALSTIFSEIIVIQPIAKYS
ncbi:MAG: hypothetical protein A2096_17010 [Spirochaetes bacterium GWF1_41_5]|nr:MAG: hypothetical protein A2096_17010 [Spirochaetes bacterium GWF1_41_5]HBE00966.1 hypothetical protein [Spirochaetia bacterium]